MTFDPTQNHSALSSPSATATAPAPLPPGDFLIPEGGEVFNEMSQQRSQKVSEQQRNRLVAWEMEYGHPLELDDDLVEAYETVYESERGERDGDAGR
jgi:hypothetical protein